MLMANYDSEEELSQPHGYGSLPMFSMPTDLYCLGFCAGRLHPYLANTEPLTPEISPVVLSHKRIALGDLGFGLETLTKTFGPRDRRLGDAIPFRNKTGRW